MACKAVGFFTTVLFLHYFVSLSPGSLRPGQLVSFPLLPRRLRHTVILSQTCENCFCLENLVAIRILGGTVGQGMSALRSMLRPGAMVRALSATSTVHMATSPGNRRLPCSSSKRQQQLHLTVHGSVKSEK